MGRILQRAGNPFVRLILRSPLHSLLSRTLILVTYTGRRTGQERSLPVMYAPDGGRLVVLAGEPERKAWWRNFEGAGRSAHVCRRGKRIEVHGQVVRDPGRLDGVRAAYVKRFPSAREAAERGVFVEFTRT
jgi:deazaflavin-dependent oxidoreductase (nitroreductase family)